LPTKPESLPEFAPWEDIMPKNALPLQAWRVVKFLVNGEERFYWSCEGQPTISESLGMLAVVQFDIMHSSSAMGHIDDEDGDDEDE